MQYTICRYFFALIYPALCMTLLAQSPITKKRVINVYEYEKANGDSPRNPGPIASLSSELRSADIKAAMRKVADWQYDRIKNAPSQNWTFPPLYDGFLAASRTLGDKKYHDNVVAVGEHYHWTIGTGDIVTNANEHALGYPYVQLFNENHDSHRIAGIKSEFEDIKNVSSIQAGDPVWWWCDALFMAPPTWSALFSATHDQRYLDYMDMHYHEADSVLWSPTDHLYFRDKKFLSRAEANGKPVFWSRGNGWVFAGLAMTLENIPNSDARRRFYLERFQDMAASVSAIQGKDGLWRTGLLDPDAYALPEVSGSAFFVYALAWGVNHRVLPEERYKPVIARGWAGLISHIYADGRLGAIQPIGDSPGKYRAGASYVYGVGAFLLAGSEVEELVRHQTSPTSR